jgi:ADP-ribose pyrophosphatase YjhB (NUDIX family)
MEESAERAFLAQLEARLAAGEPVAVEVSLALLGGQAVELDEEELRGARRRAVQLLAAGGDPRREPEPDGRAVTALAADLASPERKAALIDGLESLRATAEGLHQLSARLEPLTEDDELAWRWFACTLLADELLGD